LLKIVVEDDDNTLMAIPPRLHQNWEVRLGAPVELAVIARRPGTGRALVVRVAAMAAIGLALALFVMPTRGLILIPLAPLVLAVRDHTRATTSTSGRLPIMMVTVVTSADVILATYGGSRNPLGTVCLRIPRHELFSVGTTNSRRLLDVVLVNGETFPLSIGRPRDRALLLRAVDGDAYLRTIRGIAQWGVLPVAV
jgi:hypothetical protein